MGDKAKLMIVDDAEHNVKVMRMLLEDDYQLCEARTGLQCLSGIIEEQPDLILLDVLMPGISGYDVCRRLKQEPSTAMIPVIFISGQDLPEQRLEGYEAGGEEYIVKPVDPDLLRLKISATLEVREYQKNLQRDANNAMSTALEAMTASSEMGVLIQFLKESNECHDFEQLHAAIGNAATNFGLAFCCMMHDGDQTHFFDCNSQSLDARIIMKCWSHYRIYDFGTRTVFSERSFSMLVKNMPLDEPNRLGRIKDNVAILASMVDARIKSMLMEQELVGRRNGIIKSLIRITEEKLHLINSSINTHERKLDQVMQQMVEKLENKLVFLGLEEDQELELRRLAADTTDQIVAMGGFSKELNDTLTDVLEGLYKLLEKR